MKHNKIALIGMMGSGKSTISKYLADELKIDCFELDKIFETEQKTKIADFFKAQGEEKFRLLEHEILKKTIKNNSFILSCGGGIILKKENRDILFNKNIATVYLKTSIDKIYDRIKEDTTRPLLLVKNPKEEIEKILNDRENYYLKANIIINTDDKTPKEITSEIIEELWKN